MASSETPTAPADPVYGKPVPVRLITIADVEEWIRSVASRVDGRALRLSLVPADHPELAGILVAGADAVANGAAAYLVDAAFPSKAAPNDQTSYGQVLWARYSVLVDELEARIGRVIDGLTPGAPGGPRLEIGGGFPPPRFGDNDRF